MSEDQEIRRQIGQRLRETREYLGLSQDEVAKSLGIARPAISLIESGDRKVEALELKKFAELYQQPTAYFLAEKHSQSVSDEVAFLARAASELTPDDQTELVRFAQFLKARTKTDR
jgi:transcriptional regulator with XRE-family HTH domain